MDAQKRGGLGPDRAVVVRRARPVRRPDLDHARARAREDVGDAEAVADLDQLAAGDDDLASLGEGGQGEEHRGGVVVHDERRLGAGEPPERLRHVVLPRPARAGVEVELEVRVAAADLDGALQRGPGERRPAEVRVDDHARRVEDSPERRDAEPVELGASGGDGIARIAARLDRLPHPLERGARRGGGELVRRGGEHLVAEQPIDRRKVA